MPDLKQFRLPDVGEGLTEADILSWSVAPGDRVVVNQTLVEVETAKAAVELPSPFAGVVAALHAEPGETVEVGRAIITIDTAPLASDEDAGPTSGGTTSASMASASVTSASMASASMASASMASASMASASGQSAAGPTAVEAPREAVLVGYGVRTGPARRRVRRAPGPVEQTPNAQAAFAVDPGSTSPPPRNAPDDRSLPLLAPPAALVPSEAPPTSATPRALAKPPVRKLAKSLGVDLDEINPTGPNGSVSRADVERAAAGLDQTGESRISGGSGLNGTLVKHAPPADRGAREERIPIKGVRKHTAAAMVASAFTAPHATVFLSADVTAMMDLRQRLAARREFADVKLSPLALVARAAIWAIARTPIVNSSWDEAAGEIVVKRYVNLGIAAATGRGLVVPNIKDADGLSLRALAQSLGELAETARAGRTSPADMAGGTFTITNVGVFGVDAGTPILNPGESAILAFGAVRRAPWVVHRDDDEVIEPRWVTQLALSVDHRVVDGAQASTFLADLAAVLTDPGLALA